MQHSLKEQETKNKEQSLQVIGKIV